MRDLCRRTRFLVNDRVDLALEVGADGVHLGQEDLSYYEARNLLGPDKIIGVTVHNVAEALAAQAAGADYLGVSPIFATATKADAGAPTGVALLAEIRRRVTLPLVAIGGITLANAPVVIAAGAEAVCAIAAVVTQADVGPRSRSSRRCSEPAQSLGESDPVSELQLSGLGQCISPPPMHGGNLRLGACPYLGYIYCQFAGSQDKYSGMQFQSGNSPRIQ